MVREYEQHLRKTKARNIQGELNHNFIKFDYENLFIITVNINK